jgi:H+-transporting ATPase
MNRLNALAEPFVMADSPIGLTANEAHQRLAKDGPNAVVDVTQHPVLRALQKLWAPVPWMLEAAILLQLGLGDYVEAGVVALLLLFNAGLGFFQERRAQATLDALKSRLALVASVRRDGIWTTAPAADLVVGDVVKLSLGAVVVADVRLTDGSILLDQSMLTGESIPAEATTGALAYAGGLVRRGEALAEVTATGERTKFGRTAELVRTAKVESSEQKIVMRVVRNLALFNGAATILLAAYAYFLPMPVAEILPLVLVGILSSIPVALPSMFTLAAAVGARSLAAQGVLPTSLSAVDEAAGVDVLCSDKTGTLTRNALTVMAVHPMPGFDEAHVLALAALASSDGGQDPVDAAIRAAAARKPIADAPKLMTFVPFDPALKRSEATALQSNGATVKIAKGAFAVIGSLSHPSQDASSTVAGLEAKGFRVLAVAAGPPDGLAMAGFIALSDPPREDSAALVSELAGLGVRTVMVTGDAEATAQVVAGMVGNSGPVWAITPLPEDLKGEAYSIFAGVLPEDKYRLVKALQKDGRIVGMCGDGANDAPALRQAQKGHSRLHGGRCRQIGGGHRPDSPGPCRHRQRYQGRAHDVPANPDLHAAIRYAQGRPGPVPGRWTHHHGPRHPDADADGLDDDHRRLPFDDLIDRQCTAIAEAEYLAHPQSHDRRHCHGRGRSGVLRRLSGDWQIRNRPRHRGAAHHGCGDTGVQRPSCILRLP